MTGGDDGDARGAADGLNEVVEDFGADFVEDLRHEVGIGLVAAAKERRGGKLLRHFVVNDKAAGSREGPQDEKRIMGEASKAVLRDDERLSVNAAAATAAVFSPGERRAGKAVVAGRKWMEVDAAGVEAGVPKRVVSRSPDRQLLGDRLVNSRLAAAS